MKTIRNRTLFASFVIAMLLLLNISPALAGGQRETSGDKGKFHGRVEVIFTKWITNFPNMAGLVSGDAGAAFLPGKFLVSTLRPTVTLSRPFTTSTAGPTTLPRTTL